MICSSVSGGKICSLKVRLLLERITFSKSNQIFVKQGQAKFHKKCEKLNISFEESCILCLEDRLINAPGQKSKSFDSEQTAGWRKLSLYKRIRISFDQAPDNLITF